ncbi:rhomboid family intramembrane serine protease [Halioglobus sp. Uisw_031]|jgi:GlpG protein|uniref:rhomboid family intramembrane serine protease n=1 Tax=Halioglobus sp. Uisw_031 TaxID=3230977 RepID=UPI0039E8F99A
MQDTYHALSVALEEDLLPLSGLLHQHGVMHRIFEEGGRQIVLVGRQDQAQQVQDLYQAWRAGDVRIELTRHAGQDTTIPMRTVLLNAPVTLALILLSIGGFLMYLYTPMNWLNALSFSSSQVSDNQGLFQAIDGQYWRLITPAFLHFGWLHIVFNCLWLWDLGRRVEQVMGHLNMFMLFLVIAVVSNASQFEFGGGGLFGGMSGVVYGLLGFSWIAPQLQPAWPIQPPKAIMIFMVGWLVVCMSGMVEVLGFGAIANAAHLGGLLCGAVVGAVFAGFSRLDSDKAAAPKV